MKLSNTGLNLKQSDRRSRRARRNYDLKISLENRFSPEIRRYFNQIARKIAVQVSEGSRPQIDKKMSETMVELLRKHYNRVARAFQNEMRLFLNNKSSTFLGETKIDDEPKEKQTISRAIKIAISVFILNSSLARSLLLLRTTQKEIEIVTSNTISEQVSIGGPVSGAAFSSVLTKKLRERFNPKIGTIAITETQFSSEKVKQIEAAIVSRKGALDPLSAGSSQLITGRIQGDPEATKEWAAILDNLTRDAHVIADGQKRPINDPFTVDAEFLMEPSDSSLGASAGNTINCRCSALYDTKT